MPFALADDLINNANSLTKADDNYGIIAIFAKLLSVWYLAYNETKIG